jgi:hypothetical protein
MLTGAPSPRRISTLRELLLIAFSRANMTDDACHGTAVLDNGKSTTGERAAIARKRKELFHSCSCRLHCCAIPKLTKIKQRSAETTVIRSRLALKEATFSGDDRARNAPGHTCASANFAARVL